MTVSRLRHIPGIGVDSLGDRADHLNDPAMLRLENLDTDLAPPDVALQVTRESVGQDSANSYLPFQGSRDLRRVVCDLQARLHGVRYDPEQECLVTAGGLNGVLNVLLATVEPGTEVVVVDPIYAGLVNRIRLAGGEPRFVPCVPTPNGWELDPQQLADAITPNTSAVLMMSPAMPSGFVMGREHWDALAAALERSDAWLIYDAAMERIRFDGSPAFSPVSHHGLRHRTITVGSVSKELRMIGWRIGWVLGPREILRDVNLVGLSNVVCQVGLAQSGVAAALDHPNAAKDVAEAVAIWAARAALLAKRLRPYGVVPAHGGWSMLVDVRKLNVSTHEASETLFRNGVAATPMNGWGPSGDHYIRLVFSNEPIERLEQVGQRFAQAFPRMLE
jgi:aspartate/methionine/tyrosine aminotransferase